MTAPLSAEQQARYDRIEAAEAAPESLRERVARALWDAECQQPYDWDEGDDSQHADYYRLADAAIAVLRGPSVADEAVRRVEELADELLADRYDSGTDHGYGYSDGLEEAADRIRAALNGGER